MSTQPTAADLLTELGRLGREAEQIDARRRVVAQQAKAAGANPTEIARAADVARPTVYRWLSDQVGLTVSVAEVLDEALQQMMGHVGEPTMRELVKGLNSGDIAVKLRRYDLGIKNLQPGSLRDDEDLRAALMLAGSVRSEAQATFDRTRSWPERVTIR